MAVTERLILIVAAAGARRDELLASLALIPHYRLVGVAGSFAEAVRLLSHIKPQLVLIDSAVDDAWTILRQVKAGWPQLPCAVLATNLWHRNHALALGADLALSGLPPSDPKLFSALDSIDSLGKISAEPALASHSSGLGQPL